MAQYHWNSGLTWSQYLQTNSFVQDINKTIRKTGKAAQYTISEQTKEVIASNEALSREFGRAFNRVNGTVTEGFGIIGEKFDGVSQSIELLGAKFDWGFSLLAEKLEIQNDLLKGIQDRLEAIHQTLQTPTLTQAREFYNIGLERLKKGLLDKALEAFLKAEEKNDVDFATQYMLGYIYLYGKGENYNTIDLPKAEQHFCDAARYAKADLFQFPEMRRCLGKSYFYASITCYIQAKESLKKGDNKRVNTLLEKGKELAKNARNIYPDLREAFYHYAKLCALTNEPKSAIDNLKTVIKLDRAYCLKVTTDSDFEEINDRVMELFKDLRYETKEMVASKIDKTSQILNEYVFINDADERERINSLLNSLN